MRRAGGEHVCRILLPILCTVASLGRIARRSAMAWSGAEDVRAGSRMREGGDAPLRAAAMASIGWITASTEPLARPAVQRQDSPAATIVSVSNSAIRLASLANTAFRAAFHLAIREAPYM